VKRSPTSTTTAGILLLLWSLWLAFQLWNTYDTISISLSERYANEHIDPAVVKGIRVGLLESAMSALVWFSIGVGILRRREWARVVALISASILILVEAHAFPTFIKALQVEGPLHYFPAVQPYDPHWLKALMVWPKRLIWWICVGLTGIAPVWYGIVIWYFLRPEVKARFVKTAPSDK